MKSAPFAKRANFANKFYNILRDTYDITIIEGVDGLTIERFKQVAKSTNKIHWPPVLKGPVEND